MNLKPNNTHHERIAKMTYASVFPLYLHKIERKGRTKVELLEVIQWLTGYNEQDLDYHIKSHSTFTDFFEKADLHPNAYLITGMICGYRIEAIDNPLTQKVRYLDKLVDELAKGRTINKILRT